MIEKDDDTAEGTRAWGETNMANHKSTVVLLPQEFVAMCEADGVSPGEVLNGFLADLCGLNGGHGSDERELAQRYYDRCYPYR
jgi:hypothetical protein